MEEITSRKNPLILHIKKLMAERSYRRESREYVCEGEKLLEDALKSGARIKTVLTACDSIWPLPESARTVRVPEGIIESISSMKSPRPVIFTCEVERGGNAEWTKCVLLENLQDPGNIGTVIRTANALGMDCVLLLGDCADPFGPKAVRASMGAVFRQSVKELGYDELASLKKKTKLRLFGTFPNEAMEDARETDFSSGIIAIGNEGAGLSDEIRAMCDCNVTIPMRKGCESLNAAAAAAILMWEMCRKDL